MFSHCNRMAPHMTLIDTQNYKPRNSLELIENHLIADVVLLAGKKAAGKCQMVAHWTACITDGRPRRCDGRQTVKSAAYPPPTARTPERNAAPATARNDEEDEVMPQGRHQARQLRSIKF